LYATPVPALGTLDPQHKHALLISPALIRAPIYPGLIPEGVPPHPRHRRIALAHLSNACLATRPPRYSHELDVSGRHQDPPVAAAVATPHPREAGSRPRAARRRIGARRRESLLRPLARGPAPTRSLPRGFPREVRAAEESRDLDVDGKIGELGTGHTATAGCRHLLVAPLGHDGDGVPKVRRLVVGVSPIW
ncbi:hypothetical protein Micbo1qcDRAFT_213956, partial [Microdochium bolleyi]